MARPLEDKDFPLKAIGASVYRRTESSPLFVAQDHEMAFDIALRLNRDNQTYPGDFDDNIRFLP